MSLILALSGLALAQDADTFAFSGSALDRQGGLQLAHPTLGEAGSYYANLGLVYADDPLVLRLDDGTEESVVSRQLSFRLHGAPRSGTSRAWTWSCRSTPRWWSTDRGSSPWAT